MMKKIINYGYKILVTLLIITFLIAIVGATFFCVNRSFNYLNPLVLIIGSIVSILLIKRIYVHIKKMDEKKKKYFVIGLFLIQIIMLFISFLFIQSIAKVDLIHIITGINSLNEINEIINIEYFSVYSNNRFLLMILYYIQKISVENNQMIFGILSILSILLMSLFTYKTVKESLGIDKGILSLFIIVTSPIFYLYVSYFYTDILMLPFASILIYLIVKIKDTESLKQNIIYGIIIGIIGIIGYKIRAVSIFILIAYILYIVFSKKMNHIVKKIILLMIGLIITFVSINILENNFFNNIDKEKEFPMTHWIMMGVNPEHHAYYNHDDYKLSQSVNTKKERQALNIKIIKKRITSASLLEKIKLFLTKQVTIWGKGDYSYQKYLELVHDYNKSYNYLIEDKNVVINYLLQISKIIILFMCIKSLIKLKKEKEMSIITIALFGGVLFYSIWEVCPRYGLSFLPWLIMLSSVSFENISDNLENKLTKRKKYILLSLTIILIIGGFIKYTIPREKKSIVSKDTTNKIKYEELDNSDELIQSVKLNSSFNEISLMFIVENDTEIKIEMLDSDKNKIYDKEYLVLNKNNEKYSKIELDNNINNAKYIKVTSKENIKIATSYKEYYDYYPNGNLTINSKEVYGDLMFEISNISKRGTYTYIGYLIMSTLIIYIEYIIFFRKKEVK